MTTDSCEMSIAQRCCFLMRQDNRAVICPLAREVFPSCPSDDDGLKNVGSTGSLPTQTPKANRDQTMSSFGASDASGGMASTIYPTNSIEDMSLNLDCCTDKLTNSASSRWSKVETDTQASYLNAAFEEGFDPSEIKPWQPERFETLQALQNSCRNYGRVFVMWDNVEKRRVAVKRMPKDWIRSSHADFVASHPFEIEFPWQDMGCTKFLNSIGFPYCCNLLGVYQDEEAAAYLVVTSLATEGDLFSWCNKPVRKRLEPGPVREAFIRPLVVNMFSAILQLHELSIVHRDISMENILLSETEKGRMRLQIIDFGMASTSRFFSNCLRGKAPYQAPEIHHEGDVDGFAADAFSVGVVLYAICMRDLPWLSTAPGSCKSFAYVQRRGFQAYARKRTLRNTTNTVADCTSHELFRLLEGLLDIDPTKRLTLGESVWPADRRSVWDEPWIKACFDVQARSPREADL